MNNFGIGQQSSTRAEFNTSLAVFVADQGLASLMDWRKSRKNDVIVIVILNYFREEAPVLNIGLDSRARV